MTQVTDRLTNQHIVELAKKQFEKTQRSKVPGHVVKLPSLGLIYPASSPLRSGTVEIRYMTAYDEDILMNASYISQNIVYEKLLDSLILTPGVTASEISNPDSDAIIIIARIQSYGENYPVRVTDPKTSKLLDREVNLSEIKFKPFTLESDENGEFEYIRPDNGDIIKFKYLSSSETKQIDEDHTISGVTIKSIQSINGNRDRSFIDEYVKYHFIGKQSRAFRKYMTENMYGLDYNIEFEGENGDTFTAGFQLGSDIFWV